MLGTITDTSMNLFLTGNRDEKAVGWDQGKIGSHTVDTSNKKQNLHRNEKQDFDN